jgi:hypothetical protein
MVLEDDPNGEGTPPAGWERTALDGSEPGENGEVFQSGMCSETSTKGSTTDLSMISRSFASLGRGSCCTEMI